MKKYLFPVIAMLACNEIISMIALLVIVCMLLTDIVRAADGRA